MPAPIRDPKRIGDDAFEWTEFEPAALLGWYSIRGAGLIASVEGSEKETSAAVAVGKMVDELIGMIVIVTAKEIFLVRPVEGNELASLRLSELKSKFAELEKETISADGFIETDGTEQDAELVFSATHQNYVGINEVSPFDRLTIELKAKIKFPGGEYKSESTIKCRRIAVEEVRRRVRNTVNQCKDQLAIRPREVLLNWMKAN